MTLSEYESLISQLTNYRRGIKKTKRRDYTHENEDVLKNFKNAAEFFNVDPKLVLGIFLHKQISAVFTYIQTDGDSESEPIMDRISDSLNYLELLHALIKDE